MAKRNIARTAIEGGRAKRCRYEEHESTVRERRQEKVRLRRVIFDRDYADEVIIEHRYSFVPWIDLLFADKLTPVYRWICKQTGRKWNDVYSEICEKFDKHSLAGRHILEHIDAWVDRHDEGPTWYYSSFSETWYPLHAYDFIVDDEGILRHNSERSRWARRRCG